MNICNMCNFPVRPRQNNCEISTSSWLMNVYEGFLRADLIGELKHARFWNADGNRKRTFLVLEKYCLLDFYTTRL